VVTLGAWQDGEAESYGLNPGISELLLVSRHFQRNNLVGLILLEVPGNS
jgi:hypothetical protein